jgi:aminoglycoside/choline kinase family phosphotransferase
MKSVEEMIAFAQRALSLDSTVKTELIPFGGRGSDRSYYRFKWEDNSAILAHYDLSRIENAYFADIAAFLQSRGIAIPKIIKHDKDNCLILMDDLGDLDLWTLRNEPWNARRSYYQKALTIVKKLHACAACNVRLMEPFSTTLYRWERDYFRTHFVGTLCGIELDRSFSEALEQELEQLSQRLLSQAQRLIHRDLQSQNIMIFHDEAFLIDFQGMRFGSPFYDLGSILCDPYVSFSPDERNELLMFYYGLSKSDMEWEDFQRSFWEASAQRLMQALGAYGFLGMSKGLKNYLAHVPSGLKNLQLAAENAGSLSLLLETCIKCKSALPSSVTEIL